jgi:hypothetical protein
MEDVFDGGMAEPRRPPSIDAGRETQTRRTRRAIVEAAEALHRTTLRLSLDQWLGAAAKDDDSPVVREGCRRRWSEDTLAPLHDRVGDDGDRLITAL